MAVESSSRAGVTIVCAGDPGIQHELAHRVVRSLGAVQIVVPSVSWLNAALADLATRVRTAVLGGARQVVVAAPLGIPAAALLALFGSARSFGGAAVHLDALVVAVDAGTLLADLQDDLGAGDPWRQVPVGQPEIARAQLVVQQIEYATTLVLFGQPGLTPGERGQLLALLGLLNPTAVVTDPDRWSTLRDEFGGDERGDVRGVGDGLRESRPGWAWLLRDDVAARPMTSSPAAQHGVTAFRYDAGRPFHPARLKRLLDGPVEEHEHGWVIRSSGYCVIATVPTRTLRWNHVAGTILLTPVIRPRGHPTTLGQQVAFIGLDLQVPALTTALDAALLTDDEFQADAATWSQYPDPFELHRPA